MNRRVFLTLSGLVAVGGALKALSDTAANRSDASLTERMRDIELTSVPDGTRLTIRQPGMYQISGFVRLDEPLVEISGLTHGQSISWSGVEGSAHPVSGFTAFEHVDDLRITRTIRVRGGHLESVVAVPMYVA